MVLAPKYYDIVVAYCTVLMKLMNLQLWKFSCQAYRAEVYVWMHTYGYILVCMWITSFGTPSFVTDFINCFIIEYFFQVKSKLSRINEEEKWEKDVQLVSARKQKIITRIFVQRKLYMKTFIFEFSTAWQLATNHMIYWITLITMLIHSQICYTAIGHLKHTKTRTDTHSCSF